MESPRRHTINAAQSPHLRVGIKWDQLERDNIEEAYGIGSAENARAELKALHQQIKNSEFMAKLFRAIFFLRTHAGKFDRLHDQQIARKKLLQKYVLQDTLPSFDLDLCCFCYDQDGKFLEFISPVLMDTPQARQSQLAFMHSGDDSTGTGEAFDEEILVKLSAINPAIHQVFFVIVSINHGFDQIKGGLWSIVNTSGEKELLSSTLRTELAHTVHVMAKLSRNAAFAVWDLNDISHYCPLDKNEKIPLHLRIDRLLTTRYLADNKSAPPSD